MEFRNATILRTSERALLVQHQDLHSDIWVPRQAISVLSEIGPFTRVSRDGLKRGDLRVEGWYAAMPQCQEALAAREARTTRQAAAAARVAPPRPPEPPFIPSPDQEREIGKILHAMANAPRPKEGPLVLLLNGPAGSGKTACVKEIARRAKAAGLAVEVGYGAPTGRAASRMRQSGCEGARTVHSLFFREIREDAATGEATFTQPESPVGRDSLLVVDEASMIGKGGEGATGLHSMLLGSMPKGSILLYVGDREQLEPVKDVWGPDFAHPTGTLETIHRQAEGSAIVRVATAIRTTGRWSDAGVAPGSEAAYIHPANENDLIEWYAQRREAGADVAMIAATHALRHALNKLARERLGYADVGTLAAGDRLMVRRNNHGMGIMNGQVLTVASVERFHSLAEIEAEVRGVPAPETEEEAAEDVLLNTVFYKVRVAEFTNPDWWIIVPEHLLTADNTMWWQWRKAAAAASGAQPKAADYDATAYDDFLRDLVRWKWANLVLRRAVPVNYGECLTCHAAQGSQWASVGVAVCGMLRGKAKREKAELAALGAYATDADRIRLRFFQRWLYTAITRAAKELCVFNLQGWEGAFDE